MISYCTKLYLRYDSLGNLKIPIYALNPHGLKHVIAVRGLYIELTARTNVIASPLWPSHFDCSKIINTIISFIGFVSFINFINFSFISFISSTVSRYLRRFVTSSPTRFYKSEVLKEHFLLLIMKV